MTTKTLPGSLVRSLSLGPAVPVEGKPRTFKFTVATENPIDTFQGPEILRMAGANLSRYSKNPVVVDSHDVSTVRSILGTAGVAIQGREMSAEITLDETPEGEAAFQRVKSGSLRATSVRFRPTSDGVDYLRAGEVDDDVRGPAVIIRKWSLLEITLCAVPADEDTVRRSFFASSTARASESVVEAERIGIDVANMEDDIWEPEFQDPSNVWVYIDKSDYPDEDDQAELEQAYAKAYDDTLLQRRNNEGGQDPMLDNSQDPSLNEDAYDEMNSMRPGSTTRAVDDEVDWRDNPEIQALEQEFEDDWVKEGGDASEASDLIDMFWSSLHEDEDPIEAFKMWAESTISNSSFGDDETYSLQEDDMSNQRGVTTVGNGSTAYLFLITPGEGEDQEELEVYADSYDEAYEIALQNGISDPDEAFLGENAFNKGAKMRNRDGKGGSFSYSSLPRPNRGKTGRVVSQQDLKRARERRLASAHTGVVAVHTAIRSLVAGTPALKDVAEDCVLRGLSLADARKAILEEKAKIMAPGGTPEPLQDPKAPKAGQPGETDNQRALDPDAVLRVLKAAR